MKFEEVLPALRKGKKIRRKCMPYGYYIRLEGKVIKGFLPDSIGIKYTHEHLLSMQMALLTEAMRFGLLADDWEIVKEKKKVKLRDLTPEQFEKWRMNNCCANCKDYVFDKVICIDRGIKCNDCWIKNKDLYSDKFLDQEIEIEE